MVVSRLLVCLFIIKGAGWTSLPDLGNLDSEIRLVTLRCADRIASSEVYSALTRLIYDRSKLGLELVTVHIISTPDWRLYLCPLDSQVSENTPLETSKKSDSSVIGTV